MYEDQFWFEQFLGKPSRVGINVISHFRYSNI